MKQEKTVAIISAGAWGTAVGKVIAEKGIEVTMWDFMPDVVADINDNHQNSRFLPEIDLPHNLKASEDLIKTTQGKDLIIIATPSLYILNIVKQMIHIPSVMEGESVIGILTKGFIPTAKGPTLITKAIENYLPGFYKDKLVYISGPSHAEEVATGKITGLISASANGRNSIMVREILTSKSLLVFSSLDVVGVQVAAAVKNVIAISFGIMDALKEVSDQFGDNTESLLLASGLNEIMTIGKAMGSTHPETFTSFAGVGDLDVTCRSQFGRNRRFGREIIKKNLLKDFSDLDNLLENVNKIGYLPEGAAASKWLRVIGQKYSLKLPICNAVYHILNREIEPNKAIEETFSLWQGAKIMPE